MLRSGSGSGAGDIFLCFLAAQLGFGFSLFALFTFRGYTTNSLEVETTVVVELILLHIVPFVIPHSTFPTSKAVRPYWAVMPFALDKLPSTRRKKS